MKTLDPVWAPFTPEDTNPWDLRRVAHLHRRAGFAGTWGELQRDLQNGPEKSIDRLLAGKASLHAPPEFASTANVLGDAAVATNESGRIKAWWFYRMLFGPDPLGEKLTLMWHNHFATSNAKVQDLAFMRRQNETFRRLARAPFGELLNASVREPALLIYLDASANRKGHPNENLGRELMELFTLGVGNYSEDDVKEAARCLTGWTTEDGKFTEVPVKHDDGEKKVLTKKGTLAGSDLVKLLLENPATAKRLVWRLCDTFFGEKAVSVEAMKSLADGLIEKNLDIGWALGVMLRSKAFFAEANIGTRIKGPAEFIVGTARALEMFDPAPSTLALADWCGRMGQDLFEPPNVGGWTGGRAWIGARSMITRANFVAALVEGTNAGRSKAHDPSELARQHKLPTDANALITFHCRLLLGGDPTPNLIARLAKGMDRKMVALLLATPEFQLG
ncbi:MAG TPA: DUF1800 domain-containing protein [Gemmataceae bacterium]|jgi:uncharacterized protein (DUF1800 family)|nr:DUF1800 domain-containing protein [Gemmataceae bacterium]